MALRFYISSENAPFFNNNTMGYGSSIPTAGTYKVGDFIISSTQQDGIFGWVCVEAGTPGTWEVIGSGANNGTGTQVIGGENIVGYFNVVEFTDARSSIEIGIPEYIKDKDFLEVHYNGLLLAEGVHYNISEDGLSINNIGDVWNADADDTQQMIFRVIKSEGIYLKELNNVVNINEAVTEVEIGIEGFNYESDIIEVHLNGVLLVEGIDYNVENGKLVKIDESEPWNMYNVAGQKMFIKVFKNSGLEIKPGVGTVTKDALDPEILEKVEMIGTITDIVTTNTSNISSIDTRVAEIEEKIESGDIVTNGGGGGGAVKLSYKDNLVEVVNTNTVAIGLPFDPEKDILEVHIDGLKLAEGVHYTISEDGLSIIKVNGVWNPDSLDNQYIDFRVITAGNEQIKHLTNNVEFSTAMTEVEIGLEYEHGIDILIVHLNGIKLVEGLDFEYNPEGNKIVKIDQTEPWNLYAVDGQLFVIDVMSNVGEDSFQEKNDESLLTNDKTIVGAINELFQNANNGKNIIADAIGSPLSSDDTFAAMGIKIEDLKTDLRDKLVECGTEVPENANLQDMINLAGGMGIIGDLNLLETEDKSSIVAAINELFISDNDLEPIVNAIGSPLEVGDNFDVIENKLDTLLSTFKINMMNNGVTVEAEDKFEALINKLATLVDSEGKGIKFAEGTATPSSGVITHNCGFMPQYFFVTGPISYGVLVHDGTYTHSANVTISNISGFNVRRTDSGQNQHLASSALNSLNENTVSVSGAGFTGEVKWYAIGVGEEDNSIGDSLASILEGKGIEITGEETIGELVNIVNESLTKKPKLVVSDTTNDISFGSVSLSLFGKTDAPGAVGSQSLTITDIAEKCECESLRVSITHNSSSYGAFVNINCKQYRDGELLATHHNQTLCWPNHGTKTIIVEDFKKGDVFTLSGNVTTYNAKGSEVFSMSLATSMQW